MLTLRQMINKDIEKIILFDNATFFIPYPTEGDGLAVSHKTWQGTEGYETLVKTINSKQPTILRRAAIRYIVPTLTDTQALSLLTDMLGEQ